MRLEVETVDGGERGVVVLLHGFPMDRSLWRHQMGSLAGAGYRVVAPDLRGFGASPVGDEVATMDRMADDVLETLESLGIQGRFVLGGLSMGGYVALSLAVRYPERLSGLMLINTRAGADTPAAAQAREETARGIESTGSIAGLVAAMLARLFWERQDPSLVESMGALMRGSNPQGVVNALRGLAARPDRTDALPTLTMPTLVLAGEGDLIVPVAESREMAAAIPNAKLVILEEVGHLSPLERPKETDAAMIEFLRSV